MSLLLLSQEMRGCTLELVKRYISLIRESFDLPESTELLIKLIKNYNLSNWPPEMLELRRMLDLRDDHTEYPSIQSNASVSSGGNCSVEECESSDVESQQNSPDLRDDRTEYCAKSVEGDSLSSCNGSVSSGGNYSVSFLCLISIWLV